MRPTRLHLVLVAAVAAFTVSHAFAETSKTVRPWQRGTYAKDVSGADTLTVEGDVKIAGQSSSPPLIGEVVLKEKSATWKGRTAGQGVFYTVWGTYTGTGTASGNGGGGGDGNKMWMAWYDSESGARLVLVPYVGDLASVAVWPKNGNQNLLLVLLMGAEANKTYSIRVFADDSQKATLNPVTFDLTSGTPTKWVSVSALASGDVQIKGFCTNQPSVKEGVATVTIGAYKPRKPTDLETNKKWTPQSSMWDMGGDWEPRQVGGETREYSFYGGKQALRAVGVKDLDYDEATGEEMEDTFNKSDAIMWRCEATGGVPSGTFSPRFGLAAVWEGVASDTHMESSGIILNVRDDGRYAKDTKPSKEQMYAAYPPNQGKDPRPHADAYNPGYFLAASIRVWYYQPGEIDKVTLSDDNGRGDVRKGTNFLEVTCNPIVSTAVAWKAELKAGSDPLDATKWPKYYLDGVEILGSKGLMEGRVDVRASGAAQFGSPVGVRTYTLKVEWANQQKPDDIKSRQFTIRVYPAGQMSAEFAAELVKLITDFKGTMKKIKDTTGTDIEGRGWLTLPAAENLKLVLNGGWVERLPDDPRANEVLYGISAEAGFNPLIGIQVPEDALTFPIPAVPGAFIQGELSGSISLNGAFFRNENNPNGNGGIRGTANITGSLAGGVGNDRIVSLKAGARTGFTGTCFVGAVPAQSPGAAEGIGIEADFKWDGVSVFAKVTTFAGLFVAEESWTIIDEYTFFGGPHHWVWMSFDPQHAK